VYTCHMQGVPVKMDKHQQRPALTEPVLSWL
jgi:hypothetical protein